MSLSASTDLKRVVCFGELLLRLSSPGRERLFQSPRLDAHFGGAEGNVAVSLARFGDDASMVSIVPDDALGDAALAELKKHGVDVGGALRRAGRLGTYYLELGAGLRAQRGALRPFRFRVRARAARRNRLGASACAERDGCICRG